MGKIDSLYIYPVKSCKGIKLDSVIATPLGVKYDREWIILNKQTGKMLTQRTHPQMTQIKCDIVDNSLILSFAEKSFDIPFDITGDIIDGVVWGANIKGIRQNVNGLENALNQFLNTENTILMRFTGTRKVETNNKDTFANTQYADCYPYTVADTADLQMLNNYFSQNNLPKITMERFRANIVLNGVSADVGSNNDTFIIETQGGDITGTFCGPCPRCPIPDLDPETGEKTNHKIQRSLKAIRGQKKDWFSSYSILNIAGEVKISVGDNVAVK